MTGRRRKLLPFFAVLFFAAQALADPASFLDRGYRPSVNEVLKAPAKSLNLLTGPIGTPTEAELKLFHIYENIIEQVLSRPRGEKVFIMGRKGEPLFDAFQTLIYKIEPKKAPELLDSVRMIPISSEAAKNASPAQLRSFLTAHGVDIDATLNGAQRQVWLDLSSNPGTTEALLDAMIGRIAEDDPEREYKIKNLIQFVDPKVLIPHGASTKEGELDLSEKSPYAEVRKKAGAYARDGKVPSAAELQTWIHESLKTLEFSPDSKTDIEIPDGLADRYNWLSEKFLPLSHWHGKPTRISSDGSKIDLYGDRPADGPLESLRFQRKLQVYFSQREILDRFRSRIAGLAPINLRGPPAGASGGPEPPFIIQEIVDLPEDAVIPKEIYDTYDSRTIGESLVFRLHTKDAGILAAGTHGGDDYDVFNDSDLVPRVQGVHFGSILSKGFLNQHKSGSSKGAFTPKERARGEDNMVGLKLETEYTPCNVSLLHDIRPKYGWVSFTDPSVKLNTGMADASNYGEVILLMKDEVKRRTTYTKQDSLGLSWGPRPALRKMQGTFYENKFGKNYAGGYNEVQMWGQLDMRDVKAVLIPPGTDPKSYLNAGLPIFEYKVENVHGRPVVKRTKEVYEGDSAKMAAYEEELANSRTGFAWNSSAEQIPIELSKVKIPRSGDTFLGPTGKTYRILYPDVNNDEDIHRYTVREEAGKNFELLKTKNASKAVAALFERAQDTRGLVDSLGIRIPRTVEKERAYLIQEKVRGTKASDWYATWKSNPGSDSPEAAALAEIFNKLKKQTELPQDLKIDRWVWDGNSWAVPDLTLTSKGSVPLHAAVVEPILQILEQGSPLSPAQVEAVAYFLNSKDFKEVDHLASKAFSSPEQPGSRAVLRELMKMDLIPRTVTLLREILGNPKWKGFEGDRYLTAIKYKNVNQRLAFLTGKNLKAVDLSQPAELRPLQKVKTPSGETYLLLNEQPESEEGESRVFLAEDSSGKLVRVALNPQVGRSSSGKKLKELQQLEVGTGRVREEGPGFSVRDFFTDIQAGDKFFETWKKKVESDSLAARALQKIFLKQAELTGYAYSERSFALSSLFWDGSQWVTNDLASSKKGSDKTLHDFMAFFASHLVKSASDKITPEFRNSVAFVVNNTDPKGLPGLLQNYAWNPADEVQRKTFESILQVANPQVMQSIKDTLFVRIQFRRSPDFWRYEFAANIENPKARKAYFNADIAGPEIPLSELNEFKLLQTVRLPSGKIVSLIGQGADCPVHSRCFVAQDSEKVEYDLSIPLERSKKGLRDWKGDMAIAGDSVALGLGFVLPQVLDSGPDFVVQQNMHSLISGDIALQNVGSMEGKLALESPEFKEMQKIYIKSLEAGVKIDALSMSEVRWNGKNWVLPSLEQGLKAPLLNMTLQQSLRAAAYNIWSKTAASEGDRSPQFVKSMALLILNSPATDLSHINHFVQNGGKNSVRLAKYFIEEANSPESIQVLKDLAKATAPWNSRGLASHVEALGKYRDPLERKAFLQGRMYNKDAPVVEIDAATEFKTWTRLKLASGKTAVITGENLLCAPAAQCFHLRESASVSYDLIVPKVRTEEGVAEWKKLFVPRPDLASLGLQPLGFSETSEHHAVWKKSQAKESSGEDWLADWKAGKISVGSKDVSALKQIVSKARSQVPPVDLDISQLKWTGKEWAVNRLDFNLASPVTEPENSSDHWLKKYFAQVMSGGTEKLKADPDYIRFAVNYIGDLSSKERSSTILAALDNPTESSKKLMKALLESSEPKILTEVKKVLDSPAWSAKEFERDRKALSIASPEDRMSYLEGTAEDPPALLFAAKELEVGSTISIREGQPLTVVREVESLKWSRVYQVKDKDGKLYALKISQQDKPEALAAFHEEAAKAKGWEAAGVLHAQVREMGGDFVLKDWIEGKRADTWLKEWGEAGRPADSTEIKKLRKMLSSTAKKGSYIGDLNPHDLIWNGKDWVLVDSGDVKSGYTLAEILARYEEKMGKRWGKIDPECVKMFFSL